MINIQIEGTGGHGAIPLNPIHRWVHKNFFRLPFVGDGIGFDWTNGYDVRDQIGQIKIKDQASNYSCSGQAGSYFLEIQRRLQGINEGAISAKSIYAPIAYPGGGSTIAALDTQIGAHGANLESTVHSYDSTGKPLPEYMMIDRSWKTDTTETDAFTRAGYLPIDIPDDIDSVAQAIFKYGAVILEVAGQNNLTWTTMYPKPPSKTNSNPLWHHFICCCGAKMIDGKKHIIVLQSEGESWGNSGVQYLSEDYFSGKWVDAFTFAYDLSVQPVTGNDSIWASVVLYFRRIWGV